MTNFRLFQTKRIADDNSKFDENGRYFSKQVKNTVGKGEIENFLPFSLILKLSSANFFSLKFFVWDRVKQKVLDECMYFARPIFQMNVSVFLYHLLVDMIAYLNYVVGFFFFNNNKS